MGVSFHTCKYQAVTDHNRFEISLNQGDDLLSAVSHFKSIKVPQTAARYGLHAIGSKIISEIMHRARLSLPQQQPKRKRKHKIHKPPNSSRLKSARISASVGVLERTRDQLVSSETRALQDNRSSGDYILISIRTDFVGTLFAN